MNMTPPDNAMKRLVSSLSSIKRVHFIPQMDTKTARLERQMLLINTALVTWIPPVDTNDPVT